MGVTGKLSYNFSTAVSFFCFLSFTFPSSAFPSVVTPSVNARNGKIVGAAAQTAAETNSVCVYCNKSNDMLWILVTGQNERGLGLLSGHSFE